MGFTPVCHPVGGQLPPPTLQLHDQLLNDVKLLKARRLGKIELEVSLSSAKEAPPSSYVLSNICELISTHKYSNAYIYFHPKYSTLLPSPSNEVNDSVKSSRDAVKILRDNIERAGYSGQDVIVSGGRSSSKRNPKKGDPSVLYFRCQCAHVYRGGKVDAKTGEIIYRNDYRVSTITNDTKNQRPGDKEKKGPTVQIPSVTSPLLKKSVGSTFPSIKTSMGSTSEQVTSKQTLSTSIMHHVPTSGCQQGW